MTRAIQAGRHGGPSTRDRLIEAAIALFAVRGVHGVSLRAVGEAAGARNTAAVHYHFRDRETLLAAALDRVIEAAREPVSVEAAAALGLHVEEAATSPAGRIVADGFLPLLTLDLRHPNWGRSGQRLLGRVLLGDGDDLAARLDRTTLADAEAFARALREVLPDVSMAELSARIDLAATAVVAAVVAPPVGVAQGDRSLSAIRLLKFATDGLAARPCRAQGYGTNPQRRARPLGVHDDGS